ncbi:MAG: nitric oxide reductase large subunit [Bacteroidetes bacterium HGW-Bacteroidetes-10]|nr:MAG: nitric oxide reductase large subunit [Bacteroidetes bacterium HGW-Bacteroidetes-10]
MKNSRLWVIFTVLVVLSFAVLGYYGVEIFRKAPPIPDKVVTDTGELLFTGQEIRDGQNVWQSIGGQEVGTVWGHGAYLAPDWSADWLHKEAVYILEKYARTDFNTTFDSLGTEQQAALKSRLQSELRKNTYDPATGTLVISSLRAEAYRAISAFYKGLFMNDPAQDHLREAYSIPANSVKEEGRISMMNSFFFWATWACVTNRPGDDITYTNNWPPEELVANRPSGALSLWTGFSVILLLVGISLLTYYYATRKGDHLEVSKLPKRDPLLGMEPTPSMRATLKYFWIVTALILVQVGFGVVTAHYGVEGNVLYGFDLSGILPYSISRTWHLQLAIFWIATSWLATGLYIAPAVSGKEPKYQALGVNFLFIALLIIVVGSMAGEWMGVMQKLGLAENFWFGHQGYEYVELGRFWQAFLFVGLLIWLVLMVRGLAPALKKKDENRQLLTLFVISAIAIAAFYGAGLMWGQQTHLSIAEYWRWWVVHLWVEGFFEVFATVVTAFLFVRMGLLNVKFATTAVIFSTIVFLTGGIIGTFHHLYFSGTPTAVIALGASFSALEVVPLVLMGFEAFHNLTLSRSTPWVKAYKWPIYSLISVAFWNLVGAGIFGFLINPPIALYYMQGLNTTPLHGHTALFGVYGMLGIGLMLFVLKGLTGKYAWKDRYIKIAFWSINIGLLLMALISLLPVGIAQSIASIKHGLWFARSAEFLQQDYMEVLRWLRVIGDTIFGIGCLALAWFVIGLKTGWSLDKQVEDHTEEHFPE